MFIRTPLGRSYHIPPGEVNRPSQALQVLRSLGELPGEQEGRITWRCEQDGKLVGEEEMFLSSTSTVTVLPAGGLPGGKGGFGSLLRAIGAQIEKTTNHEAMRDLSGRRQREVNNEQRVRDYMSKQGDRDRLEQEKKEAKMEKLRRLATGENKDKHSFSDPLYDKARSEVEEKVHDAVEAAMNLAAAAESHTKDSEKEKTETNKRKIDTGTEAGPEKKKTAKGLWMGDGLDDLNDSDLSDSSDDEEDLPDDTKSAVSLV